MKLLFQNEGKIKIFLGNKKAGEVYHHYICNTIQKKIAKTSQSSENERIRDGNLKAYKQMKCSSKGKYTKKYRILHYCKVGALNHI